MTKKARFNEPAVEWSRINRELGNGPVECGGGGLSLLALSSLYFKQLTALNDMPGCHAEGCYVVSQPNTTQLELSSFWPTRFNPEDPQQLLLYITEGTFQKIQWDTEAAARCEMVWSRGINSTRPPVSKRWVPERFLKAAAIYTVSPNELMVLLEAPSHSFHQKQVIWVKSMLHHSLDLPMKRKCISKVFQQQQNSCHHVRLHIRL